MGMIDFKLGDIGEILTKAREAITGKKILDPAEMATIDLELQVLGQAARNGQIEINKIEAASDNLFVAGWRPFIGWVCGFALAYAFVLQPIIEWIIAIIGITIEMTHIVDGKAVTTTELITTPALAVDTLYQLVIAMLGMATLRTYEKEKQIAREK